MNKKDLVPVILLALLIPVWIFIDRTFIAPKYPAKVRAPIEQPAEVVEPVTTEPTVVKQPEIAPAEPIKPIQPQAEEKLAVLENEKIKLEFTSLGGGIKNAILLDYPEFNDKESSPVKLDFSAAPALTYTGLPGIRTYEGLNLKTSPDGKSVIFSKTLDSGVLFNRTITIGDGYLLEIKDRFSTTGSVELPAHRILTGRMENPPQIKAMRGVSILGVDSYSTEGVLNYWGRKLNKLFGKSKVKPLSIDLVPTDMNGVNVGWVSAKNKFFTQILHPSKTNATMSVLVTRQSEGKGVIPESIAAALNFQPQTIAGNSTSEINYSYYIGPKKYSILKTAGFHMEKVMEFETIGKFAWMNWLMEPARKALLWTLNIFHGMVGNYGVSIILLTLLVRILFWPLTHKSTEKMAIHTQQMQAVQPKVKALQEKYKSNPKRVQEETMKLYKQEGVNPMGAMGGCLPMFIQLPVFFALFSVLRNAIELRYANFLWIADLSTAENLLAGQIPIIGSINILPVLMSISMIFQQKLTPQAATTPEQEQQQKMMMYMMPIMMLFFFYPMPAGLVLYWTTSNLLMILQTVLRNRKKKKAEA